VKRWCKRHFVLENGRLHWSPEELKVEKPADTSAKRSFIDFSRSVCEVVESGNGVVALQPGSGRRWNKNGSADGGRSGSQDALLTLAFDAKDAEIVAALREHVEHGVALRNLRMHTMDSKRMQDMKVEEVDMTHLPTEDGVDQHSKCCICLDELVTGCCDSDAVIRTACGHHFHKKCVGEWSRCSGTCPICRTELA